MFEWLNSHANLPAIGGFLLIAVGVFFLLRMLGMLLRLVICAAIIAAGVFFFYKYTHTPAQTSAMAQKADDTLQAQADRLQQEINAKVSAKTQQFTEKVGRTISASVNRQVQTSVRTTVDTNISAAQAEALEKAQQDAGNRRLSH